VAAMHLAEAIRKEYGDKGFILAMTGTPAPKSPLDWYWQVEIICPGYLKEGNIGKFKSRLCLCEMRESIAGGQYPHLITWLDDENKCATCGELKEHQNHQPDPMGIVSCSFTPSKNEVKYLYERLKGLVQIKFLKDCTDIPDRRYRVIRVRPSIEILQAAKLIKARSPRAITALTLLRELSDGFQYTSEKIGEETCPNCNGTGKEIIKQLKEGFNALEAQDYSPDNYITEEVSCHYCGGTGQSAIYKRDTDSVTSPKDKVLLDVLDQHEDVGRLVVWGGFTGTIDRLIELVHKEGWATLRYDRKVQATNYDGTILNTEDFLDAMDRTHPRFKSLLETYPRICFIGHPQAGGEALTLHASPTELYYSNCFDGMARIQSERRIHRLGMDTNRGATIIDIVHLPTDLLVLDNLRKKKKLQNLTMDALNDSFVTDIEMEDYDEQ
jgi:SNF2 family DNA or RNA helicase